MFLGGGSVRRGLVVGDRACVAVGRRRRGTRRACAVFAAVRVVIAGIAMSGVVAGRTSALNASSVSGTTKVGYWMLGRNGAVYGFGSARGGSARTASAVSIAPKRDGSGFWVVDALGRVYAFGTVTRLGGVPARRSGEIITTMSATPSGHGYWLFTNRGRVFAYGDARLYGSLGAAQLNQPIIASVATPTGHGYYMVGSDGGVFSFG